MMIDRKNGQTRGATFNPAAALRRKAELARRLANALYTRDAGDALRRMADELDQEAAKLERARKER